MNIYKKIKHVIAFFILIITLATVSGFTGTSTNFSKPKTELLYSKNANTNNAAKYQINTISSETLDFNSFSIFNFKCLLNKHAFDSLNTQNSQKKAISKFLKQQLLDQNFITQLNTSSYKAHTS